ISVHHRGDTAMRTWMRLAPAVLLVLPFAPATVRADAETNAKNIEQLQKDFKDLRRDLEILQNEVRTNSVRGAQTAADIREILRRLDQMASTQETVRRYAPPPPDAVPGAAAPTTGTITVRNQYTADATISINGRPYRVPAGREARIGNVPLGPINYDVEV